MPKSGEIFRELAELLPLSVIEIDGKGDLMFANHDAFNSFGYAQDDLSEGLSIFQMVTPEDREKVEENVQRILSGKETLGNEYTAQRKDGSTFPVIILASPIVSESGPMGVRGIVINITERKRAEETLRWMASEIEQQARALDEILSASPDHIYMFNRPGKITYASRAAARALGVSQADMVGKTWQELGFPSDTKEKFEAQLEQVFVTGQQVVDETRFPVVDGVRYYEYILTPIRGADYDIEAVVFTSRDITKRKHMEDALRKAQEELEWRVDERTDELKNANEALQIEITERQKAEVALRKHAEMLDLANDTIMIRDLNDTITYWNYGAEQLYGWRKEEIQGQYVDDVLQTIYPNLIEEIKDTLLREGYWEGELTHAKRNGTRITVASRWTLQRDEEGTPIAILEINNDITERKQTEAKIARLNRLYTVLSKTNEAMWRVREPKKLYEEACRIAVEDGLFRMAWIGKAEPDTHLVKPVAYWGFEEGYLDSVTISVKDVPEGRGPTGTALREGRYVICNDYEHDPQLQIWNAEGLKRGYRSSAAFPLKIGTRTIGALTLYADEQHFFDDEQIQLLGQLADDVAFAIEFMEREKQRKRAENNLRKSEQRFRSIFNNVVLPVALFDLDGCILMANNAICRFLGYPLEELVGVHFSKFTHLEDLDLDMNLYKDLMKGETDSYLGDNYQIDKRYVRKDGKIVWGRQSITLVRDNRSHPQYTVIVCEDITKEKRAEESKRLHQKVSAH
jgi:PAS domain S-box-containing protein